VIFLQTWFAIYRRGNARPKNLIRVIEVIQTVPTKSRKGAANRALELIGTQ
jgi:hypothetical protein